MSSAQWSLETSTGMILFRSCTDNHRYYEFCVQRTSNVQKMQFYQVPLNLWLFPSLFTLFHRIPWARPNICLRTLQPLIKIIILTHMPAVHNISIIVTSLLMVLIAFWTKMLSESINSNLVSLTRLEFYLKFLPFTVVELKKFARSMSTTGLTLSSIFSGTIMKKMVNKC